MNDQLWTITALNLYLKHKLDGDAKLTNVLLRGEISNFTRHRSGHCYFSLKDDQSKMRCVLFAKAAQHVPFALTDGLNVIAHGDVTMYERDGQIQLYVASMQPDGIGRLHLALEQLKQRLQNEGLFSLARKRKLPLYPRTIGVITSPTGAAICDIVTTIVRRNRTVHVLLYPVSVQGVHAAPSIVQAIHTMNRRKEVDVLIVGRGGGSLEELWAFHEESVARALAASHIPTIAAVGHETDWTIACAIADVRAPTPTAAAELAVPMQRDIVAQLSHQQQRLQRAFSQRIQTWQERLLRLAQHPVLTSPARFVVTMRIQRHDRATHALYQNVRTPYERAKQRLEHLSQRLHATRIDHQYAQTHARYVRVVEALQRLVTQRWTKAEHARHVATQRLVALSPLHVILRGYSIVYGQRNAVIHSVTDVQAADEITVRLADGVLHCHVLASHAQPWIDEAMKGGNTHE